MIPNLPFDTADLHAKDQNWIHPWEDMVNIGHQNRTVITGGDGIYVYDSEGNRLIDGPAGMWCVNIGHGRAEMADAIAEQARRMTYYSPWGMTNAPAAQLAARITEVAPAGFNHVFFTTGGSTAVDSALRFVMFMNNVLGLPDKKNIISLQGAYHGSTYLAAACSGKERDKSHMDFERGFVHQLSAPNPYRRPDGVSVEDFCDAKVQELEDKIRQLGPDKVAAFIAEPVQASGGVIVLPPGYHAKCQAVCRTHDVVYISDEVVTGFGRLGHFFASKEVFGIDPDIIISAKGLTSGYQPLGAVLIADRLLAKFADKDIKSATFSNGYTYSGHPVACAAGLKNIEIIEREKILENVLKVSPHFQARLHDLLDIPIVGDARGMGLMGCVECTISKDQKNPLNLDYEIGNRIDKHCQDLGLVVRPMINMCVMSPPLTITIKQIDEMMDILRQGIELSMEDVRRENLWSD